MQVDRRRINIPALVLQKEYDLREVTRVSADAADQIKGSRGSLSKTEDNSDARLTSQVLYFDHVLRILKHALLATIVPRGRGPVDCLDVCLIHIATTQLLHNSSPSLRTSIGNS